MMTGEGEVETSFMCGSASVEGRGEGEAPSTWNPTTCRQRRRQLVYQQTHSTRQGGQACRRHGVMAGEQARTLTGGVACGGCL